MIIALNGGQWKRSTPVHSRTPAVLTAVLPVYQKIQRWAEGKAMIRVFPLIILSLTLAGCNRSAGSAPPELAPLPARTASSALAAPTDIVATATVSADAPLVTYRKTGGITVATQAYTILDDGNVVFQIEPNGVAYTSHSGGASAQTLMDQIAATGIYDIPPRAASSAVPCCDRYRYMVTLYPNGEPTTYSTYDGDASAPQPLLTVVSLIEDYIARAQPVPDS